jgi:hypothetical protein
MIMFKKLMFAVVPMLVLSATTFADDALSIDLSTIAVADANIVEVGLDLDVDQLAADAGKETKTDAIEACFRRCGYSGHGWGGGYNSCYGSSYGSWQSPCYTSYCQPYCSYTSYSCAQPVYYSPCAYQPVCQPVYQTVCRPVCQYWGCY